MPSTKHVVGGLLLITSLVLFRLLLGSSDDDETPGGVSVKQTLGKGMGFSIETVQLRGDDDHLPVRNQQNAAINAISKENPNKEFVKSASIGECEKKEAEIICKSDERFLLKPQRPGTGEGTDRAPFGDWNVPYHKKRAAARERYQAEEALLNGDQVDRPVRIHTFYTIDCTLHSLWQVLALEMSWEDVKQGGFISRVSSGCDSAGEDKRIPIGKTVISKENQHNFGSFYAPTFSTLPNGDYYAPFNRPNGIWFWLNHSDLTEDVYIALDPDMLYINRLAVGNIRPGHFVSQYYGYMTGHPYDRYDCPLCPSRDYYSGKDTQSEHRRLKHVDPRRPPHKKFNFDVGPPWMFTLDDLITIMPTWVALVPMLRAKDKDLWIVEMVAYSVACAYHDIPHEVIYYGMVDNVGQEKVWEGVALTNKHVPKPVALIHYCFTWEIGEDAPPPGDFAGGETQHKRMERKDRTNKAPVLDYYHFSKYRVPSDWPGGKGRYPHNIFDCSCPLIQEFHTPAALPQQREAWLRTVTFLEIYLPELNRALTKWKTEVVNCSATELNLEKRLRTSHPRYWISDYLIDKTNDDRKTVEFHPSPQKKEKPVPG